MALRLVRPAASIAATLNTILAAGDDVRLLDGSYVLETALVVPTLRSVRGAGSGRTLVTTSLAPAAGSADDPTNALIKLQGTVDTTYLNTTLSANAAKGATSIAVTAAGTLVAGQWIRLHGHNNTVGGHSGIDGSSGANITLTEIVKVASSYAGGLTVPLASPLQQYHTATNGGVGTACVVTGVVPVERVRLEGFDIAAESGTMAVAILADFADDLTIRDVTGAGFSRALVNLRLGTRDFDLDRLHSRGECNAVVVFDSTMAGRVGTISSSQLGKRFHANGIPRAGAVYYNRCTSITHERIDIKRHVRAGWVLNGVDLSWDYVHGDDLDLTEAAARDPSNAIACFWQQCTSPLADVEFGSNHVFGTMTWTNCRQTVNTELQCALWLHDVHGTTIGSVRGSNEEASPNASPFAGGIWMQDVYGSIGSIYLNGVNYGLHSRGAYATVAIGTYENDARSGSGVAGVIGIMINHSGAVGGGPRIGLYRFSNLANPVYAGSDFTGAATKDFDFEIGTIDAEGTIFRDCVLAKNVSGGTLAVGDLVEVSSASPAGTREMVNHSAANQRGAMVATAVAGNNLYGMVSMAPVSRAAVLCTTAAVAVGDIMEASATAKQAVVNNAATAPNRIGRALRSKAGGSTGVVPIGPA